MGKRGAPRCHHELSCRTGGVQGYRRHCSEPRPRCSLRLAFFFSFAHSLTFTWTSYLCAPPLPAVLRDTNAGGPNLYRPWVTVFLSIDQDPSSILCPAETNTWGLNLEKVLVLYLGMYLSMHAPRLQPLFLPPANHRVSRLRFATEASAPWLLGLGSTAHR
jgi:hypothetical protein